MEVKNYKLHPFKTMEATGKHPTEYQISHRSTHGCAVWSMFLFDMARKIQKTGTDAQIKKYEELQEAYVNIVGDVSHVNRLEYLVREYQLRLERGLREIESLKSENEKLIKTIAFNETV